MQIGGRRRPQCQAQIEVSFLEKNCQSTCYLPEIYSLFTPEHDGTKEEQSERTNENLWAF